MKAKTVIKAAAKEQRWTVNSLSRELGYAYPTGFQNTLNRTENIGILTVLKCLDFLGYELIAKPKKKGTGLSTYTITAEDEE